MRNQNRRRTKRLWQDTPARYEGPPQNEADALVNRGGGSRQAAGLCDIVLILKEFGEVA